MSELVSILIPAYNAEKWIKDTINSALSQTWPKKEIIIVDDGSQDNTLQIARQFESKSVKVVTQENCGASSARNKAYALSQGDFIQWLDADDLMDQNKIAEQLKNQDIDRGTKQLLSGAHGLFFYRKKKAQFVRNDLWQDLSPLDWMLIRFNKGCWIQPSCWLISRNLAELTGPWDERLSLNDDGEYSIRLVAASEFVKFIPQAVVYYRYGRGENLSWRRNAPAFNSLHLSINLKLDHLLGMINNQETVEASVKLLNRHINFLKYFSFDDNISQFIEETIHSIKKLGGEVKLNPETNTYRLCRLGLGIKKATELREKIWRKRMAIKGGWDQFLGQVEK